MKNINLDIEDVKRASRKSENVVDLHIKTTKEISDWMSKQGISPTMLFNKLVKQVKDNQ